MLMGAMVAVFDGLTGTHLRRQAGKVFLAAFGLFGTVFGIYSYYDTRVVRNISYDVASNVRVFGKDFSSSNIVINPAYS
jgi:hypothetical protein